MRNSISFEQSDRSSKGLPSMRKSLGRDANENSLESQSDAVSRKQLHFKAVKGLSGFRI
jgi:hypothetical protein